MGLDINIYRITKPNTDSYISTYLDLNKFYNISDEELYDHLIIPESEIDKSYYKQLKPYCEQIKVIYQETDFDRMYADYGIDKNKHYTRNTNVRDLIYTIQNDDGTYKHIYISQYILDNKYTSDVIKRCYICKCEEEKYWRKEYDIQKWFHEHLEKYHETEVENCGYYMIPEFIIKHFMVDQLDHPFEISQYNNGQIETLPLHTTTENSALFYCEDY